MIGLSPLSSAVHVRKYNIGGNIQPTFQPSKIESTTANVLINQVVNVARAFKSNQLFHTLLGYVQIETDGTPHT